MEAREKAIADPNTTFPPHFIPGQVFWFDSPEENETCSMHRVSAAEFRLVLRGSTISIIDHRAFKYTGAMYGVLGLPTEGDDALTPDVNPDDDALSPSADTAAAD